MWRSLTGCCVSAVVLQQMVRHPSRYYLQAVSEDSKASEDESPELLLLEEKSAELASPFAALMVDVREEEGLGPEDVPRPVTPRHPAGAPQLGPAQIVVRSGDAAEQLGPPPGAVRRGDVAEQLV